MRENEVLDTRAGFNKPC